MFWSQFVTHYTANAQRMPAAEAQRIRLEGIARLRERQKAGRADGPLLFDDLINQIEAAVSPRLH